MTYATIDDLRSQLGQSPMQAAYAEKQLHPIPEAATVERGAFILERVTGKRVLEFGASGPLTDAIRKVASAYLGVDREARGADVLGFDLDDVTVDFLPGHAHAPEVIVCGEVIEHLSNPGWFLTRLRLFAVPVIVTVPNAFSAAGQRWIAKGIENVNADHVAWYSPKTLSVLLTRAGYTAADLYYYNGRGPTAEGLIVVTE